MTNDLAAFLRECLDEDEQVARAAAAVDPAPWVADAEDDGGNAAHEYEHGYGVVKSSKGDLWACTTSGGAMAAATTRHIARHDPARVLAEIDAKRRIVDAYALAAEITDQTPYPDMIDVGEERGLAIAVRSFAAVYRERPGFKPEWAPAP